MKNARPFRLGGVVLALGLVLSVALAWGTHSLYLASESKLLRLRVRDASSVLSTATAAIETPLLSAAAVAGVTHADVTSFDHFAASYAGTGRDFTALSLWALRAGSYQRVAVAGHQIAVGDPRLDTVLASAARTKGLSVSYLTSGSGPAIGYAVASGAHKQLIVLGEQRLPSRPRLAVQKSSAFSDLDYALFLVPGGGSEHLISTTVSRLPLSGEQATAHVPFGDGQLVLVMSPRGALAGAFFADFAWLVGGAGLLVTVGAALTAERLVHGRRLAEEMASRLDAVATENQRLYEQQRTIAGTLQHALLPDVLPQVAGLDIGARYVAGARDLDIGGDWYDVVPLDDGRVLVVVGDVSGRGLRAAAIMASLRFATRAFAVQGDAPAVMLAKMSRLLSFDDTGHFATAVCVLVDAAARELTVTNAGHPPPLVVSRGQGVFLSDGVVGVPIGVTASPAYESVTALVPDGATLLLFTDGLVERRGEVLDEGLDRLRDLVVRSEGSLDEMLTQLVGDLMPQGPEDDTAMVGLRWTT